MELIIVRHALPLRFVGQPGEAADPELSEIGHQQAKATADFLAAEGVDHIVASTMTRAIQTAAPLADSLGLDVEARDEFRESDHRSHVYVPADEFSPDDPATAHYFEGDLYENVFSDGYDVFRDQVTSGFDEVIAANKSKTVAVFCHGMVTGVYLQSILDFPDVFKLFVDYCGITRVRASSSGNRSVRSVNETHHVRDLLG